MRRSSLIKKEHTINVVPYIDVLLIILIIFLITTPLTYSQLNVELPKTTSKIMLNSSKIPLIITIDKDKNLFLNRGELLALSMQQILLRCVAEQSINPELKIFIKADKNIKYNDFIRILSELAEHNIQNVGLLTTQS